jgi:anti-sigma factor RsiW
MSCDPERITAFVDGALDEVRARLTEDHLAGCPACREQAEAERALRQTLRALPLPEPRAGLEALVRRHGRASWGRRLRWALPLAAGLAAIVLWVRAAAPFVAWELARDHDHCFGKQTLPAQVWSSDPDRVAAWLGEHDTAAPLLPERAHGLELVGVRRCPLLDRRVGHVYYASRDSRLSLYVVPGSVRLEEGLRTQSRGKTVRLLRVAGTVVGLVSEDGEAVDAFAGALSTTMALIGQS